MAKFAVILPAAGRSSRFHDKNYKKPFAPLANKAVWLHSAEKFVNRPDVKQMIVVVSPEDREYFQFKFSANTTILGIEVVEGGAERTDSVSKALARVKPDVDYVCIHDAARPCIADEWISEVFAAAEKSGAAICAIPVAGTLKRVGANHKIEETISRTGCGKPRPRRSSAGSYCSRPTPSGAIFRPPTTRNWSNVSATRSPSSPVRPSI